MKLIISMALVMTIFLSPSFGGNYVSYIEKEKGVALLKGEKDIAVLVSRTSSVEESISGKIMSDAMFKFRSIGVEPIGFKWGKPILNVELNILKSGIGRYSGQVSVNFSMTSMLSKNFSPAYSKIWESSRIFENAYVSDLRNICKESIDEFLNDYLEANPRKFITQ